MIESLSSLVHKAMDEALGLSRYRVDVHDCSHFWMYCVTTPLNPSVSPGGMTWRSPAPLRILPATRYC